MHLPPHVVLTPSYKGEVTHGRRCVSVVGCSVISTARHALLAEVLMSHPGVPQLWLDDDVIVTDRDIWEMFYVRERTEAGIVTGWYPLRTSDPKRRRSLVNNQKPGGYHGRYSDIAVCAAGCMLIMPSTWEAFPRDSWLWSDSISNPECLSGPPAFTSHPSWDRINTTEDFDFCLNATALGVRIVSANNVSATHGEYRIPPAELLRTLQEQAAPLKIEWCTSLAAATRSTSEAVLVGPAEPSRELIERASVWCVDFGHPARSPRFASADLGTHTLITPKVARLKFYGVPTTRWDVSFPEAKRVYP